MALTTIGPIPAAYPAACPPALVEIKESWGDEWESAPALEFGGAHVSSASHDLGSCTLIHRYGVLRHPWESVESLRTPAELTGWWVRVSFVTDEGPQVAWIGRITGEGRTVFGPAADAVAAGIQRFEALGPQQILRGLSVGRSWWSIGGDPEQLDWLPPLNEPDAGGGNRSLGQSMTGHGLSYLYGGTSLWTYRQYAEYVLSQFADHDDGPRWTLGGQLDILDQFTDPVQFAAIETVDSILRRLIRTEHGLDYRVVSTDDGFEVQVFALTRTSVEWGGAEIEANPDTVEIVMGNSPDLLRATVARSSAQRYGTIRLVGGRIVVCCSVMGSGVTIRVGVPPVTGLVDGWITADALAYIAGTGTPEDAAALHDAARRQERYGDVYQTFLVGSDWLASDAFYRAPHWDGEGEPLEGNGPMQTLSRATLPWIPLWSGVDYSEDTPVDSNPAGTLPDLRLPQAWLYDQATETWTPSDQVGIGLSVLPDRLGVHLHANPPHLLGLDQFTGSSETDPVYDCRQLIVTLAFETDQRLYCEQAIVGAAPGDGLLEIAAEDCRLWWLAPDTIVDLDADGQPVLSPAVVEEDPGIGTLVRNDFDRMVARMAGVVSRYYAERARAEIVLRGWRPWGDLVGQILTQLDEGGVVETIESPITQVRWTGGDEPQTILSAGFAGTE